MFDEFWEWEFGEPNYKSDWYLQLCGFLILHWSCFSFCQYTIYLERFYLKDFMRKLANRIYIDVCESHLKMFPFHNNIVKIADVKETF